jgi:hypothetical protein
LNTGSYDTKMIDDNETSSHEFDTKPLWIVLNCIVDYLWGHTTF